MGLSGGMAIGGRPNWSMLGSGSCIIAGSGGKVIEERDEVSGNGGTPASPVLTSSSMPHGLAVVGMPQAAAVVGAPQAAAVVGAPQAAAVVGAPQGAAVVVPKPNPNGPAGAGAGPKRLNMPNGP